MRPPECPDSESQKGGAGVWGEGVFNGHGASLWEDEERSGDGLHRQENAFHAAEMYS